MAADGTLIAGQSFGATMVTRVSPNTGTYQVCFNVPITNGTYLATIGLPDANGSSAPGEITVQGRVSTTDCLYVQTFDSAGLLADRSFHVGVFL
ncbi:hypothetical protein OG735_01695 [Streptomyces sp. NBC_01210]|uniref:hypothetical protein n=1 Tax=Streptomyces sp. NBC_01210 TaxID=2903774 RepID=UPI002E122DA8|nr:hypothetical protein OG735_01695 [Streptomyces sp. NBC_01210]